MYSQIKSRAGSKVKVNINRADNGRKMTALDCSKTNRTKTNGTETNGEATLTGQKVTGWYY